MSQGQRYIAYYRVSTHKQGASGLGINAKMESVYGLLSGIYARSDMLLDEFVEVESGIKDDRPELQKPPHLCELRNAKLVVSKLDRLSRDLHFITS